MSGPNEDNTANAPASGVYQPMRTRYCEIYTASGTRTRLQWSNGPTARVSCSCVTPIPYPDIGIGGSRLVIFLIKETIRYILTFYGIRTKYVVARMPLPKTDVGASK